MITFKICKNEKKIKQNREMTVDNNRRVKSVFTKSKSCDLQQGNVEILVNKIKFHLVISITSHWISSHACEIKMAKWQDSDTAERDTNHQIYWENCALLNDIYVN